MKILHLSSEYTWRGGEQQIAYLLEELRSAGVENIVAVKRGSVFEQFCRENNYEHIGFAFKNSLDVITAYRLKNYIRASKPDLIHTHTSKGHGILAVAYALGLKVPSVLSRRVDFELKSSGFSNWKYNLKEIRRIICVSKEIERIVRKNINKPERAVTVYSGVDLNRFQKVNSTGHLKKHFQLPDDSFLVGNTSAIADHKDYFTFVDTAEEVLKSGKQDIFFFIIGDGPMKQEIIDYVQAKNLRDRILFTGFLTNIPEILKELDIFLMTSKTEGLGTSVLDAFASRLPVVSTDGGGLKETVVHEITGLRASVGNHTELAQHLLALYHQPDKRKALADNAYKSVNQFSKERTAKETLKIYQQVLL